MNLVENGKAGVTLVVFDSLLLLAAGRRQRLPGGRYGILLADQEKRAGAFFCKDLCQSRPDLPHGGFVLQLREYRFAK